MTQFLWANLNATPETAHKSGSRVDHYWGPAREDNYTEICYRRCGRIDYENERALRIAGPGFVIATPRKCTPSLCKYDLPVDMVRVTTT